MLPLVGLFLVAIIEAVFDSISDVVEADVHLLVLDVALDLCLESPMRIPPEDGFLLGYNKPVG